jgi:hypothetical protein
LAFISGFSWLGSEIDGCADRRAARERKKTAGGDPAVSVDSFAWLLVVLAYAFASPPPVRCEKNQK